MQAAELVFFLLDAVEFIFNFGTYRIISVVFSVGSLVACPRSANR